MILNDNIKGEHLGIKKLHLNRKGDGIFAKNLLNIIEGNWFLNPLRYTYNENENACNASIATFSDAKRTLENICISNINKLIFGHLNINSLKINLIFCANKSKAYDIGN